MIFNWISVYIGTIKYKDIRKVIIYDMSKYKSIYISEDDLNIQTDWYMDEQHKRVDVVKLTMYSTKLDVTVCSYNGQLDAYNKAFEKLDNKYYEWLLN